MTLRQFLLPFALLLLLWAEAVAAASTTAATIATPSSSSSSSSSRSSSFPPRFSFQKRRRQRRLLQHHYDKNNDKNGDMKDATKRVWVAFASYTLPFSADVAYKAFSDMERQASWSDYLKRVEYLERPSSKRDFGLAKFVASVFGIPYGAKCVGTNIYPWLVEWRSISGVRYTGRVTFTQRGFGPYATTIMDFTITFIPPRLFAAVFGKSKAMVRFVEKGMMLGTMRKFSEVVQREDLKRKTILLQR